MPAERHHKSVKCPDNYLYFEVDFEDVADNENLCNHCEGPAADEAPEGGVEGGEGSED